ncbi:menaquinol-cytochrome c reductase cytochrome b/c subunit [Bacillus horti]|uniref:Menaquinol-cytochrome c reductase cytochrome b/c subunit n=1 Tax=Caldalkalibacillus horti TaxID=77523 RepID=A0ABT9VWY3_9BACI|nr:menaquinol-cytochrome c reductase cytochrome b/c subunit [Bacillus horti]MDQ0165492.1 menaquinol-cytochrome c reductase cytochrome b/c subunit [Bacillus horti]
MASNHDKNIKYVGDSRIRAERTPNIPKDYSEYPGKTEAFYPNFLLREWMVGAVVLVGFLCLTAAHEPPLELVADPTAVGYAPVPDWYFLFLFQLLKYSYFGGPYLVLGTIVVPGIAFTALALAPWLDRGPERRPSRRPIATGLMLLAVVSLFYLTWAAAEDHDWSQSERYSAKNAAEGPQIDTTTEGYEIFAQSCIGCHGDQLQGAAGGPPLNNVGDIHSADEIRDIIINGYETMPAGMFGGTDEELDVLVDWLASLSEENEGNTEE